MFFLKVAILFGVDLKFIDNLGKYFQLLSDEQALHINRADNFLSSDGPPWS